MKITHFMVARFSLKFFFSLLLTNSIVTNSLHCIYDDYDLLNTKKKKKK